MNFVEPIRDRKKIAQIKNLLRGEKRFRDLLLFTVGINTALRISDLLRLRIEGKEETHNFGFIEKDDIHTYRGSEAIIPLVEQYNPEDDVVIILVKDEEANAYWLKTNGGDLKEVVDSVFTKQL